MHQNQIRAISSGIFLVGLAILFITKFWWPGILLVLWVSVGVREYLSRRYYDFFISTIILLGLFAVYMLKLDWNVLVPVVFVVGAIYIVMKEFFFTSKSRLEEKIKQLESDLEEEKEEEKKGKHK